MMKKIFLMLLLALPLSAGAQSLMTSQVRKLAETIYCIENFYLDTVNVDKLVNDALTDLISKLDPHSAFVPASEADAFNSEIEGEFEGVGVSFRIYKDTLSVEDVIAGGPSERVGIRPHDCIIAVDGQSIAGVKITNEKVFSLLRGPKGSQVTLTVLRRGVDEPMDFVLHRDVIPVSTVPLAFEPEPGYLYIRVSRFAKNTVDEIIPVVGGLDHPLKGLILDLSDNGGGALATALSLTDQFLEKGDNILTTESRGLEVSSFEASGRGVMKNVALAVIINENSASASEIVSGALQDNDRAVIIGRKSFGKGLVQRVVPLSDGDELKLTVSRYRTPSGRCIQSPYELGKQEEYYKAFMARYRRGESFNRDSITFDRNQTFRTVKSGREVYGGGGIMPDIFIPADTTWQSEYYLQLVRKSLITDFAYSYASGFRDSLITLFPDPESFREGFTAEGEPYGSLLEYAAINGVPKPESMADVTADRIRLYVSAIMAQTLYGSRYYYLTILQSGVYREYEKALEVVRNWDTYRDEILLKAR